VRVAELGDVDTVVVEVEVVEQQVADIVVHNKIGEWALVDRIVPIPRNYFPPCFLRIFYKRKTQLLYQSLPRPTENSRFEGIVLVEHKPEVAVAVQHSAYYHSKL
jgi:hypothetical protein